jgi:hypothetical protein
MARGSATRGRKLTCHPGAEPTKTMLLTAAGQDSEKKFCLFGGDANSSVARLG